MAFAGEDKLAAWAHSWLDVDGLMADIHLLFLSITQEIESLEVYFLLAAIVKLFKSALHHNGQI